MHKWAYLAGLIDGDGSIYVTVRKQKYFRLVLGIANANLDLLRSIEEIYGRGNWTWRSKNYIVGDVKWEARKAQEVIAQVLPYLLGKKKQAELAMEFPLVGKGCKGFKKKQVTTFRLKQKEIYEQMHALNRMWSKGKIRKTQIPVMIA